MARSRLLTSAQVLVYINGKPFAWATSFRWESATPRKAIYGLDSGEPYELAPTTTKVHGSVGLLRLSASGGLEGAGVVAQYHDIPREKYFTLTLVDRTTDTIIFTAGHCAVQSQSWDIPAKGRVTGSMTFEALDWNNEAKPA